MVAYGCLCIACLAAYALGLWHIRVISRAQHTRAFEFVYAFAVVSIYLYCVSNIYVRVGAENWNFHNALPTANVSPFTFSLCLAAPFLPRAARRTVYSMIALLSFGMLAATILEGLGYMLRDYTLYDTMAFDMAAYLVLSLFGVYLVQSGQVTLRVREVIWGGLYIVVIALTMLVLNAVFGTAYFGLSFAGEHNIYGVVLPNAYLSAAVYFVGLGGVLAVGYRLQLFFDETIFGNKKGAHALLSF